MSILFRVVFCPVFHETFGVFDAQCKAALHIRMGQLVPPTIVLCSTVTLGCDVNVGLTPAVGS